MKRFLHPSLPIILGLIGLFIAVVFLVLRLFFPGLLQAQSVEGKDKEEIVLEEPENKEGPELPVAQSTGVVAGSHVLSVRNDLISKGETFVEANLTDLTLRLYEAGEIALEVPIKSKGREGSWWETPVGVYQVTFKKENHFSSFGSVYQPWSLAFQGNFFIHGWPYYPDGTPVSSQYSGGCIRLSSENAEAIYKRLPAKAPVLVYQEPESAPPLPIFTNNPKIQGRLAIYDVPTGTEIRSHEALQKTRFGSTLNLLTALTAVDFLNIEKNIILDGTKNSPRLKDEYKVTVYDLLHLLLAEQDSAAAHNIARGYGVDAFTKAMSNKAKAIGLNDSVVVSTDQNDPRNITTPADMSLLLRYLAEHRSFILQVSREPLSKSVYGPPAWDDLRYEEQLVSLPGFIGGTFARAGSHSPATAVVSVGTGTKKRKVAIAITDSPDPMKDLVNVIAWLNE